MRYEQLAMAIDSFYRLLFLHLAHYFCALLELLGEDPFLGYEASALVIMVYVLVCNKKDRRFNDEQP
jgi:hypothetical protein